MPVANQWSSLGIIIQNIKLKRNRLILKSSEDEEDNE